MNRFHGFWWRPDPNSEVEPAIRTFVSLGITDLCVWAEPFVLKHDDWTRVRRAVQESGIRFHTWITVNHHYSGFFTDRLLANPDWAAVHHSGASCITKPFAGFQYWLCPANQERLESDWQVWAPLVEGADGLHLDYIRYPDGFRFGEQPEVSRVEVVEQSYCYCDKCIADFQQTHGLNAKNIPIQEGHKDFATWQQYRQARIIRQVRWFRNMLNQISSGAQQLSAAVFPTPDIARRNVQQDWATFADVLDFVCPMIYAKQFWGQPIAWTKTAVQEGVKELNGQARMIAGLGPLDSYDEGDIESAITCSEEAGADGEILFVYPATEGHVQELARAWKTTTPANTNTR